MNENEEVMSQEDKFFGKTNVVGEELKEEIELEIVDDRPPQDRRPPAKASEDEEESDEELQSYSAKVRKRIDKLKYQQHEERRQREAAERMREEAVRFAQELNQKNQRYEQVIQRGETALVQQIKARASIALEQAKSAYKDAYERGDTEKIIEAQEKLLNAQGEIKEAERYERNLKARPEKPAETTTNQPQRPQPSPKAVEWVKRNPWFGPQGNREMTALAYGVHESLVRDHGVQPDTDEYYQKIDEAMRARFPEHFERDNAQRAPAPVVAPSTRNNGAKPRRIQLTATQVSLAKRLGLTPEQYAKQLIKESANGR